MSDRQLSQEEEDSRLNDGAKSESSGSDGDLQEYEEKCLKQILGFSPWAFKYGFPDDQPEFSYKKYLGILEEENDFEYLSEEVQNPQEAPPTENQSENVENQIQRQSIQNQEQNFNQQSFRPEQYYGYNNYQNRSYNHQESPVNSVIRDAYFFNPQTGKYQRKIIPDHRRQVLDFQLDSDIIVNYESPTHESNGNQPPAPTKPKYRRIIRRKQKKQEKQQRKEQNEQNNGRGLTQYELFMRQLFPEQYQQQKPKKKRRRLTDSQKPEIRYLYGQQHLTPRMISDKLHVSRKTVSKFIRKISKESQEQGQMLNPS